MTPHQTQTAIDGLQYHRLSLAWQTAALSRHRRLPSLESLTRRAARKEPQGLKTLLKGMNRG